MTAETGCQIPWSEIEQYDDEFYDLLESTTLRNCPFCDSDDIKTASHLRGETGHYYHLYSIMCRNCNVSNTFERPKQMFQWWNQPKGEALE